MEEKADLSDEELLAEYSGRSSGSSGAVQAVVCIILGASLFALNMLSPGLAEELLSRFRKYSEGSPVCPDPIDLLMGFFDRP